MQMLSLLFQRHPFCLQALAFATPPQSNCGEIVGEGDSGGTFVGEGEIVAPHEVPSISFDGWYLRIPCP